MIFFQNFLKEQGIIHGILEKEDGGTSLWQGKEAVLNVLRAISKLGFRLSEENLIFAQQIHQDKVFVCPKNFKGAVKLGVDALLTKNKRQILVVRSADCLPILIYDKKGKQVAAIHAGREGLLKRIILKTIKVLKTDPKQLKVGIGPHIRKCHYSFSENFFSPSQKRKLKQFLERKEKIYYLDLTKMAFSQLQRSGVKRENIEDLGICTFCDERFFSLRRDKDQCLSFASFIGLV